MQPDAVRRHILEAPTKLETRLNQTVIKIEPGRIPRYGDNLTRKLVLLYYDASDNEIVCRDIKPQGTSKR